MRIAVIARRVAAAWAAAVTCALVSGCAPRETGVGAGVHPASGIADTSAIQAKASRASAARASGGCRSGSDRTGFEFSFAADARGYSSPRAAAVEFSRHNTESAPAIAADKWTVSRSGDAYIFRSGNVSLSVVRLPNRTWIVDSGTICS